MERAQEDEGRTVDFPRSLRRRQERGITRARLSDRIHIDLGKLFGQTRLGAACAEVAVSVDIDIDIDKLCASPRRTHRASASRSATSLLDDRWPG